MYLNFNKDVASSIPGAVPPESLGGCILGIVISLVAEGKGSARGNFTDAKWKAAHWIDEKIHLQ